jgi:hypothetical protein
MIRYPLSRKLRGTHRGGLDILEKSKIPSPPGFESGISSPKLDHYTDYAIMLRIVGMNARMLVTVMITVVVVVVVVVAAAATEMKVWRW